MFCPKCGTENDKTAKFCVSCGYQLREITSSVQQIQTDCYAGFWRRFAAHFIDSVILGIAGGIIGGIVGAIIGGAMGASGADMETIQVLAGIVGYIIGIVLNWLYFTLFESSLKQATPGKLALGILVTDLNGRPISFGRANGRYWGKVISVMTLFIGFILAGFTQKKQALHDIMAETLVVKKLV